MKQISTTRLAITSGLVAVVIGLVVFVLHWNFWDVRGGPFPGYEVFLFPGNITLIYIWHPIFTEEINLLPKLALVLTGQFTLVTGFVALLHFLARKWLSRNH